MTINDSGESIHPTIRLSELASVYLQGAAP